jgi:hypothetical protein
MHVMLALCEKIALSRFNTAGKSGLSASALLINVGFSCKPQGCDRPGLQHDGHGLPWCPSYLCNVQLAAS